MFPDHSHTADVPEFRRYNLIYGFNGSGKTTLSRLLRCLEVGSINEHFAVDSEFSVSFSDNTSTTHQSVKSNPNGNVVVFNADFIEENLRWREGKVSPVFFIGNEQARLAELVERLNNRLAARATAVTAASQARDRAASVFTTFKRDTARHVADALQLGRRYTAPSLEQDMSNAQFTDDMRLNDEQLREKKATYYKLSAGDSISAIAPLPDGIISYLSRVRDHCAAKFSGAVIEAVKEHGEMLKWAKDGLDYHKSHEVAGCLFCGNALTPERIALLERSIDDRFARTVEHTEKSPK